MTKPVKVQKSARPGAKTLAKASPRAVLVPTVIGERRLSIVQRRAMLRAMLRAA